MLLAFQILISSRLVAQPQVLFHLFFLTRSELAHDSTAVDYRNMISPRWVWLPVANSTAICFLFALMIQWMHRGDHYDRLSQFTSLGPPRMIHSKS